MDVPGIAPGSVQFSLGHMGLISSDELPSIPIHAQEPLAGLEPTPPTVAGVPHPSHSSDMPGVTRRVSSSCPPGLSHKDHLFHVYLDYDTNPEEVKRLD